MTATCQILWLKTWRTNGIKLAFGETVKEVAGDGKVEKIITDKNEYDVDMVILAVGFVQTLHLQVKELASASAMVPSL